MFHLHDFKTRSNESNFYKLIHENDKESLGKLFNRSNEITQTLKQQIEDSNYEFGYLNNQSILGNKLIKLLKDNAELSRSVIISGDIHAQIEIFDLIFKNTMEKFMINQENVESNVLNLDEATKELLIPETHNLFRNYQGKATGGLLGNILAKSGVKMVFIFMQRLWRVGTEIDVENCVEVMQSAVEEIQEIPVAGFFNASGDSDTLPFWSGVTEQTYQFLKNTVLCVDSNDVIIPKLIRDASLVLLLEMGLIYGSLSMQLKHVIMLIELSSSCKNYSNLSLNSSNSESVKPMITARIMSVLIRMAKFVKQSITNDDDGNYDDKSAHISFNPCLRLLNWMHLDNMKDDEPIDADICLLNAAVYLMSCLDCLTVENQIAYSTWYKAYLLNNTVNNVSTYKYEQFINTLSLLHEKSSHKLYFIRLNTFQGILKSDFREPKLEIIEMRFDKLPRELNEKFRIKKIVCSGVNTYILSDCGWLYEINSTSDEIVETFTFKNNSINHHFESLKNESTSKLCMTNKIIDVHANIYSSHVLAVTEAGQVYSWGTNTSGKLGHGDTKDRLRPTIIDALCRPRLHVHQVACGEEHSLILIQFGEIYSCGRNHMGQLGLGDVKDRHLPTRLASSDLFGGGVKQIAGDGHQSMCLTNNGVIYTWGSTFENCRRHSGNWIPRTETCVLDYKNEIEQIQVHDSSYLILLKSGSVFTWLKYCVECNKSDETQQDLDTILKHQVNNVAMISKGDGEFYFLDKSGIIRTKKSVKITDHKFSGFGFIKRNYILAWSLVKEKPQLTQPFILEVSVENLKLLSQLISSVIVNFGTMDNENNIEKIESNNWFQYLLKMNSNNKYELTEDRLCILISSLHLLSVQLQKIVEEQLTIPSALLIHLKRDIINCCCGAVSQLHVSIKHAAHMCLISGWKILFSSQMEKLLGIYYALQIAEPSISRYNLIVAMCLDTIDLKQFINTLIELSPNSSSTCSTSTDLPSIDCVIETIVKYTFTNIRSQFVLPVISTFKSPDTFRSSIVKSKELLDHESTNGTNFETSDHSIMDKLLNFLCDLLKEIIVLLKESKSAQDHYQPAVKMILSIYGKVLAQQTIETADYCWYLINKSNITPKQIISTLNNSGFSHLLLNFIESIRWLLKNYLQTKSVLKSDIHKLSKTSLTKLSNINPMFHYDLIFKFSVNLREIVFGFKPLILILDKINRLNESILTTDNEDGSLPGWLYNPCSEMEKIDKVLFRMKDLQDPNSQLIVIENRVYDIDKLSLDARNKFEEFLPNRNSANLTDLVYKSLFRSDLLKLLIDCYCGDFIDDENQPISYCDNDTEDDSNQLYFIERMLLMLTSDLLLFHQNCCSLMKTSIGFKQLQDFSVDKFPSVLKQIVLKKKNDQLQNGNDVNNAAVLSFSHMEEKERDEVEETNDLSGNSDVNVNEDDKKIINTCTNLLMFGSASSLIDKGTSPLMTIILQWLRSDTYKTKNVSKANSMLLLDNIQDSYLDSLFTLILVALVKHINICDELANHIMRRNYEQPMSNELSTVIQQSILIRKDIIKRHQQTSVSYKELCSVINVRCRFLIDEIELLVINNTNSNNRKKSINLSEFSIENSIINRWKYIVLKSTVMFKKPRKSIDYWQVVYNFVVKKFCHSGNNKLKSNKSTMKLNHNDNINEFCIQINQFLLNKETIDLQKLRTLVLAKKIQFKCIINILKEFKALLQFSNTLLPGVQVSLLQFFCQKISVNDNNDSSNEDDYIFDILQSVNSASMSNFVSYHTKQSLLQTEHSLILIIIQLLRDNLLINEQKIETFKCTNLLNNQSNIIGIGHWPNAKLSLTLSNVLIQSLSWSNDILHMIVSNGVLGLIQTILRHYHETEPGLVSVWCQKTRNYQLVMSDGEIFSSIKNKYDSLEDLNSSEIALPSQLNKGTLVLRGRDWKYGDQDGPNSVGVVKRECINGMVRVQWLNNKKTGSYRAGKDNFYDLRLKKSIEDVKNETPTESGIRSLIKDISMLPEKFRVNRLGKTDIDVNKSFPIKTAIEEITPSSYMFPSNWTQSSMLLLHSIGQLMQAISIQQLIINNQNNNLKLFVPSQQTFNKIYQIIWLIYKNGILSYIHKNDSVKNMYQEQIHLWCNQTFLLTLLTQHNSSWPDSNLWIDLFLTKAEIEVKISSNENVINQILTFKILERLICRSIIDNQVIEKLWNCLEQSILAHCSECSELIFNVHSLNGSPSKIRIMELSILFRSMLRSSPNQLLVRNFIFNKISQSFEPSDNLIPYLVLFCLFSEIENRVYPGIPMCTFIKDGEQKKKFYIGTVEEITVIDNEQSVVQVVSTSMRDSCESLFVSRKDINIYALSSDLQIDTSKILFPFEIFNELSEKESELISKFLLTLISNFSYSTENSLSKTSPLQNLFNIMQLSTIIKFCEQNLTEIWYPIYQPNNDIFRNVLNMATRSCSIKSSISINELWLALNQLLVNFYSAIETCDVTVISDSGKPTDCDYEDNSYVKIDKPKKRKTFLHNSKQKQRQSELRRDQINLNFDLQFRIMEMGFTKRQIQAAVRELARNGNLYLTSNPESIITTILNSQQENRHTFSPVDDAEVDDDNDYEDDDDSTGLNLSDENSSCSTNSDRLQYMMPRLPIHSLNLSDNDDNADILFGNIDIDTNEEADSSTDNSSDCEENLTLSNTDKHSLNKIDEIFNVVCIKSFGPITVGDEGNLNSNSIENGHYNVFWIKINDIIQTDQNNIHIFNNPKSTIVVGDEVKFTESGIKYHSISAMIALSNGIVRQIIGHGSKMKIAVDFPNSLGKICDISDLKLVGKDHYNSQCQACLKCPILLPIYKCKVCQNLYLCSNCYSKFQRSHNHKFTTISVDKETKKPAISTGNSIINLGKSQTISVTASSSKSELKQCLSFSNFSLDFHMSSKNIEYTSTNNHCLIKIAEGFRAHKIFMLISLSEFLLLPSHVIVKKGSKIKTLLTVYRAHVQTLKEDTLIINSSKYYNPSLKLMWLKIFQDKITNQSDERVFSLNLFDESSSSRTMFNAVKLFHIQLAKSTDNCNGNKTDTPQTIVSNENLLKSIFAISDKKWSANEIDTISNNTIINWRQSRINKLRFQIKSNTKNSDIELCSSNDSEVKSCQGDMKLKNRLKSKIYVWGLNDKDQLGCEATSKVKLPILNEALSELDCVSISGGSKSLFCVTRTGKVYAAGDPSNGRLGIGLVADMTADIITGPKKLEALDKYFIVKVAVHSGGRHAIALTKNGEIFSWGEGDDGKLGHNSRLKLDSPRKIKYFKGKRVVDIACGSSHSAAIVFNGNLYTWGLGDYGRLGHGDTTTQLIPELVKSLRDYKVVQVACGSRDAQTLALTSDFTVWSWGDGDFGKLGRGGSSGCLVPHKIECMSLTNVIQIECGAQSSFALTENGQVWTWGKGDYYRLGHGTDKHIREPMLIEDLKNIKIIHLAVGALHCLAATDHGQVYSWGDNDHGQQGNGTVTYNMRPTLVTGLAKIKIAHVACGSSHSVAWTASDLDSFLPSQSLNRWPHIKEVSYSLAIIDFSPLLFKFNPDPLGSSDVYDIDKNIYQKKCRSNDSTLLKNDDNNEEKEIILDNNLSLIISQIRNNNVQVSVIHSLFCNLQVLVARTLVAQLMARKFSQSTEISELNSINEKLSSMETFLLAFDYLKLHYSDISQSLDYLRDFLKNVDFDKSHHLRQIALLLLIDEIEKFGDIKSSKNNGIHHYCENKDFVNIIKRNRSVSMVRESPHPYIENSKLCGKVVIPDAPRLIVEFDRQCSTERNKDVLILMDRSMSVVAERSGQRWEDWGSKIIINGNELHWSFKSDGSITAWGWRFEVKPLWKQYQANKEKYDVNENCEDNELFVLFSPNVPLIKGLLERIELQFEDTSLVLQLIKSLSQMAFSHWDLDCESRIWAIRQILNIIRNLNLGVFSQFMKAVDSFSTIFSKYDGKNVNLEENAIDEPINFDAESDEVSSDEEQLDNSSQLINDMDTICGFLLCLQKVVLKQFKFEEPEVKSSKQLFYSRFLKSLIELSCFIRLDSLSPVSTVDEWAWFRNYCLTLRTTESLITNSSLPFRFINEFKTRFLKEPTVKDPSTREINAITAVSEYADPREFGFEHDLQVVGWLKSRPESWKKCWPTDSASGLEVWSWGHNHRGQLGGVEGSKIKVPVLCEHLSALRPRQIIGGEQSLFIVSIDGRVYATGFGNNGRLGIGSSESVQTPILVSGLEEKIVVKVAVNSGGKHCLALCNNGLVYAWGDAEDHKLGLDKRLQPGEDVLTPTLVKALVKAEIVDIAAGGSHSAAISRSGELYTWGKGRYGRLGHGNGDDQSTPKIVEALRGHHVIGVACGSGDAQTLCITKSEDSMDNLIPNTNVWSWGDGDYGKLGRGGFDICKFPMKIETLEGVGVIKVDCGSQFSLALTSSGEVYTWGKGDYFRLGHGSDTHVRKPEKVSQLNRKKIIDVACGSLHCICCTEDGEVYSWGDNDEGQLGDGTTTTNSRPRIIETLTGKGINRVACGSAHTLAWTTVSGNKSHETESPEQRLSMSTRPISCHLLENKSSQSLINRFLLLHHWTELFCANLHFMDLNRQSTMDKVRQILLPSSKESLFRLMIQTTMYGSKKHGPEIKVNRLHASAGTPAGMSILYRPGWSEFDYRTEDTTRDLTDLSLGRTKIQLEKTVFGQLGSKLIEEADCISKSGSIFVPPPDFFLLPNRVWKVKLIGESVDDCGGGYSESITEICDELQNGHLPFLISSPDKDCFVLSPNTEKTSTRWFIFLGCLLGIAIRTNQPLSLTISDLIWKILSGQSLNKNDLKLFDKDLLASLMSLRTIDDSELESLQIPYSVTTIDGQEVSLVPSMGSIVTAANRDFYIDAVINYKIHEFDQTCLLIRRGMSLVIPLPLLNLFSSRELECLVCGNDSIPISFLKSITLYRGVKSDDLIIMWFWEIMEEMTNEVRSLFLRFVWGRTRLPRYVSDLRGKEFVIQVLSKYSPADEYLPEAYTCFFLLKLPNYSSKAILQEKLLYAIHFCKSIDIDDYARIALNPDSLPCNETAPALLRRNSPSSSSGSTSPRIYISNSSSSTSSSSQDEDSDVSNIRAPDGLFDSSPSLSDRYSIQRNNQFLVDDYMDLINGVFDAPRFIDMSLDAEVIDEDSSEDDHPYSTITSLLRGLRDD